MSEAAAREIPVIVVIPPRVLLLDVAGPMEVLRKANLEQGQVRFAPAYVGPRAAAASSVGLALAGIAALPAAVPDGALIVVPGSADQPWPTPALPGGGEDEAAAEAEIVAWLRATVRPGVRLATICSGALLAGRAGLLDGYACTTHHATLAALAHCAPAARVCENRLFVEDGERLSSAGISTGVDLMLHLVAREAGPRVAMAVARYLVVYMRRGGDDPQLSPWLEGRNHVHPAVHRLQDIVAADPARGWTLPRLAREAGISPRHLSRLFHEHAGLGVMDYVNRMRVALARELVAGSRADMETVAEKAGFSSPRQLRRVWGRFHARPPSEWREAPGGPQLT